MRSVHGSCWRVGQWVSKVRCGHVVNLLPPRALQVLSRDIRSAHQRALARATAGASGAARVHACADAGPLQAAVRSNEQERHSSERSGVGGCSGAAEGCIGGSGAALPAGSVEEAARDDSRDCMTGSCGQQAHAGEHMDKQVRQGAGPACGGVFRVTLLGIEVSYDISPAGLVHVCGACYRPRGRKEELSVCI